MVGSTPSKGEINFGILASGKYNVLAGNIQPVVSEGGRWEADLLLFSEGEVPAQALQCQGGGGAQGEDQDRPRLSHW